MDVSVTEFRAQCLELIRRVEEGGEEVQIRRYGKLVARLSPPTHGAQPVWQALRGSGVLQAEPEESVVAPHDFDALR